MTIRRSLEILELRPDATLEEVKQAYKDSVSVWHPDRFSNNPRLRQKAERKLKEINAAFAEVKVFLSSRKASRVETGPTATGSHGPAAGGAADEPPDTAEVIAEAGTRLILGLWSYLSEAVSRAISGGGNTPGKGGRRPGQRAPGGDEKDSG